MSLVTLFFVFVPEMGLTINAIFFIPNYLSVTEINTYVLVIFFLEFLSNTKSAAKIRKKKDICKFCVDNLRFLCVCCFWFFVVMFLCVRARSCKKVYEFALNTIYLRFKAFCVYCRGGVEKKNAKKYAKILLYQKKVVILHRGFVRA